MSGSNGNGADWHAEFERLEAVVASTQEELRLFMAATDEDLETERTKTVLAIHEIKLAMKATHSRMKVISATLNELLAAVAKKADEAEKP